MESISSIIQNHLEYKFSSANWHDWNVASHEVVDYATLAKIIYEIFDPIVQRVKNNISIPVRDGLQG